MHRSHVAALNKGTTIACELRLAAAHVWGSETVNLYETVHSCIIADAPSALRVSS